MFEHGSFLQSKMYAAGVTCSDCHNAHSLKQRGTGNNVCGHCHLPLTYDTPAHHHHKPGTEAARCASCHMRTTTYMVVDPRYDHSMRVPRVVGANPLVFETDLQVGGISKTINYDGNRMDLGGHRFFSKSDWVMDWWHFPQVSGILKRWIVDSASAGLRMRCAVRRPSLSGAE